MSHYSDVCLFILQVKRLILSDQNFPQIIANSFLAFPNLRYLDLSYSNVASMQQFAFNENRKLDTLILNRNSLTDIPTLFESSDNSLEALNANNNNLVSLDSTNLQNLLFLSLEGNLFTESNISQTLSHLLNLYHLSLESNEIGSVTRNTFSNQKKLQYISLWNNQLTNIEPGAFDHITTLQYLNIKSNEELAEYRTEAWHFCNSLESEVLTVEFESNKTIVKDLKIDSSTEMFCTNNPSHSVETACSGDNGHLTCEGNIEDLICELRDLDFKSITFSFPKDKSPIHVENFFEAETDAYFQEINGRDNMTQYLADLKLYGTKFDLASLDDYIGLRTETVTIFADTIYMSRPLKSPIKSRVSMRARVVSISEDIAMNMTKQQLFDTPLEADQPVDNWASVEEVVTGVGNTSFSIRKQGYIQVQKEHIVEPLRSSESTKLCTPRYFDVHEYESDHHTPPAVFFDRVQLNLLRVSVRTLASTRSNDPLALAMADHTLAKTADPTIVDDKKAYIAAQKLIRDKEIIKSHNKNVPFYTTSVMSELAEIMFQKMSLYKANETLLMLKLDIALGRMADMNKNFEDAKRMRELYFELELQTLEEIWNSTDTAWHWTFNASRSMEEEIQNTLERNMNQTFEMQKNELTEMLERARDTVESDQAVVDKFKAEIDRYSEEAQMSMELQRQKLKETDEAGEVLEVEQKQLEEDLEEWKRKQMLKALFGFMTAIIGVVVGIATMQPEIAGAAIGAEMEEVFEGIEILIEALEGIEDVLNTISDIGDIDINMPDIDGDLGLYVATNWRGALENAYKMKNMTSKFNDIRISGETEIAHIGEVTGGEVDPTDMRQAMLTYTDRGTQLTQETVNFAELMMHLADLAGDLQVAELDLKLAIEDVERIEQMLVDLQHQQEQYMEDMEERRQEYEDKCDEFASAYDTASDANKEAYKQEIMDLFDRFNEAFEASNKEYIAKMNELTAALYAKVAGVTQHSMVQRSMIMNLYQDYCDGLFYFSFTECFTDQQSVPTMSDDFDTLLLKLNEIEWNSINSMESWNGNFPQYFDEEVNSVK